MSISEKESCSFVNQSKNEHVDSPAGWTRAVGKAVFICNENHTPLNYQFDNTDISKLLIRLHPLEYMLIFY